MSRPFIHTLPTYEVAHECKVGPEHHCSRPFRGGGSAPGSNEASRDGQPTPRRPVRNAHAREGFASHGKTTTANHRKTESKRGRQPAKLHPCRTRLCTRRTRESRSGPHGMPGPSRGVRRRCAAAGGASKGHSRPPDPARPPWTPPLSLPQRRAPATSQAQETPSAPATAPASGQRSWQA